MSHFYRRISIIQNNLCRAEVSVMLTYFLSQNNAVLLQYVNILRALRYITSVYADDQLFSQSGTDTIKDFSARELALRILLLKRDEQQRKLFNAAIDVAEYQRTSSGNVGVIMVRNTFTNSFLTVLVHNKIIYRISAGRFLFLRKFRKRNSVVIRFGKLIREHLARWSREYGVINWKFILAGYRRFAWTFFSTIRRMKIRMHKTYRYYKRRFKLAFSSAGIFYHRVSLLSLSHIRYGDGWRRRQHARTLFGKIRRILRKRRLNFGIFGVHAQRLLDIGKQVCRPVVFTCTYLYDDYSVDRMQLLHSIVLPNVLILRRGYTYSRRVAIYIYNTLYLHCVSLYRFFTFTEVYGYFIDNCIYATQSVVVPMCTSTFYLRCLVCTQTYYLTLRQLLNTRYLVLLLKKIRRWVRVLGVRTRRYFFSRYRRVLITEEMLRSLAFYFSDTNYFVKRIAGMRNLYITVRNMMRWWYRRAYRRFFVRSVLRYYSKQVTYTINYYVRSVRKPFNGIRKVHLVTKRNPRGIWR